MVDVWGSRVDDITDGHVHMQALTDEESLLHLGEATGIDRMALVAQGLNDLRDLFTPDIEQVRLRRRR